MFRPDAAVISKTFLSEDDAEALFVKRAFARYECEETGLQRK